MRHRDLKKSWAITRGHLAGARAALSSEGLDVAESAKRAIREYEEFLDHNELELAMDMLEHAVQGLSAPPEFWSKLLAAAENMGLPKRVADFRAELES